MVRVYGVGDVSCDLVGFFDFFVHLPFVFAFGFVEVFEIEGGCAWVEEGFVFPIYTGIYSLAFHLLWQDGDNFIVHIFSFLVRVWTLNVLLLYSEI